LLKVLDLFAGIGGFSLGLERTGGFETVAFCEIEPYAQKVLAKHWPGVPIYDDVRELTADRLASDGIGVDVITGGFPCQPHSNAARGRNPEDKLASEFWRVICGIKPKYVIAENVAKKAFPGWFVGGLMALGYTVSPANISAADIGADHTRSRWWVIAHPHDDGQLQSAIDAETQVMREVRQSLWGPENYARAVRVPHGLPNRSHRLKCLGNAVVPQIPELIGRAILEAERLERAEDQMVEVVVGIN
jgi:DNA (cytosine-5)-methyltransferase 1